ncbi:MAG: hypothetical protein KGO49_08685 [Gammaproteobacteria bacterium]|nr:hypothetical protein [Gammaproteobacteria bacterium]
MTLPECIIPLLKKISDRRDCKVEFWNELVGDELIDAFLELSGELKLSEIDEQSIPNGYINLAYVFDWESHCQFSGWLAIENNQDEMAKILSCYRNVGLSSEADALEAAVKVWFSSNQDHDAVGAAYSAIANEYSDEDKRFSYLAEYFSKNAKTLLYIST